LLHAAQLLKSELTVPFKLVCAGTGLLHPALEKLVHELGLGQQVIFPGFRSDIGDLLAASDIVVLPTLREGLSIALLEAMAAGKPIVTTTIGSNIEATQNGRAALLVPPRNPRALADAVIELVRDPRARVVQSKRAKEVFAQHYTEVRMLDGYRTEYLALLQAAHQPATARFNLERGGRAQRRHRLGFVEQTDLLEIPPQAPSPLARQRGYAAGDPALRSAVALQTEVTALRQVYGSEASL
jgi:hypothetical protein